jgi:hypothetical protein
LTPPATATQGTPVVSVIVAAYRVTEYIREALESVLAQTFRDYEIIVVNDGCPDTSNLERVLAPYRGRIVYLNQENAGPSSARNAGIRVARGSLLAVLDPDDVWEPNYLEVQVRIMREDPTIDVLSPDAIYFGDSPLAGRSFMAVCPSEGEVTFTKLLRGECSLFYSVTARREVIVRAGLYDPALRTSEDFDLWLRILKQGGRIAYNRKPLLKYRVRQGSLTSDPVWLYQNVLKVFEKVGRTMDLTPEERRTLDQATQSRRAWLELELGKKALSGGDSEAARIHVDRANRHFHKRKLSLVVGLLRYAPWVLRMASRMRGGWISQPRRG